MNTNKVVLIGYVGKNLHTKRTATGNKLVSIRMATHYRKKSGKDLSLTQTDWHDVVAWNTTAEYAERHFVKGSRIMVEGAIIYRCYLDQVGHKRYVTEIKAHSLINLDR